jgi:hypothetical protein
MQDSQPFISLEDEPLPEMNLDLNKMKSASEFLIGANNHSK